MTIVKTARWWIQKYAPKNVNKFDINFGGKNQKKFARQAGCC